MNRLPHPDRRLRKIAQLVGLFALGDLFAVTLLPISQQGLAGPVLLATALVCLAALHRAARHRHQPPGTSPGRDGVPRNRAERRGQAHGGPCDGQPILIPLAGAVPAEVWLAPPGQPGPRLPNERYLLNRSDAGKTHQLRYHHAPIPPATPTQDPAHNI